MIRQGHHGGAPMFGQHDICSNLSRTATGKVSGGSFWWTIGRGPPDAEDLSALTRMRNQPGTFASGTLPGRHGPIFSKCRPSADPMLKRVVEASFVEPADVHGNDHASPGALTCCNRDITSSGLDDAGIGRSSIRVRSDNGLQRIQIDLSEAFPR